MQPSPSAMQDQERAQFFNYRDRHPTNQAAVFMENHVALPGQPLPVFSERAGGFVSLEEAGRQQEESAALWKEVDEEKERLFELMQQVQRKLPSETSNSTEIDEVTNLRKCSWKEVMGEVQKTAQRWKTRPSKYGKTMLFIDKVGQYSGALESWLQLLPMGDYGSSICGVFKLAVGAAGQYGKVEEAIFGALAEIPRIMESAKRYVDIYHQMRDHFLEQRTFELFRAILTMLRHVMQFFADGKTKKTFEMVVKQGTYKDELRNSVEEIKKRAQAVNEEASQCQARMLAKVHEHSGQTAEVLQRLWEFLLTHPLFGAKNLDMLNLKATSAPLQVSGYDLANVDNTAPSDDDIGSAPGGTSSKVSRINRQPKKMTTDNTAAATARIRLLQYLRYDPEELPRDISSSRQLGSRLDEKSKARTAAMVQHPMFRTFLEDVSSSTSLLVNGRDDLSSADGISPLRYAVAELAAMSATLDAAPVFVIQYYCAAHQCSPVIDPTAVQHSSAVSMMASLVGQLLGHLTRRGIVTNLSFLTESKWRKLERLEPDILCKVFRKLLKQTPLHGFVICIIDEVSLYESHMLQHTTDLVMEKLVRLASGQSTGHGKLKLLVTCQNRAFGVGRYFEGHTLDLPEDIEEENSAEWAISTIGA